MPRRPNFKNHPGRSFEESATPIYFVSSEGTIAYVNQALALLLKRERQNLVGLELEYLADSATSDSPQHLLCPPPSISFENFEAASFEVTIANQFYLASAVPLLSDLNPRQASSETKSKGPTLNQEADVGSSLVSGLAVFLHPVLNPNHSAEIVEWAHAAVQKFRETQDARFQRIPFLGKSPASRRCFAQAQTYALSQANVCIVAHPESQAVDLARSIHHSGFSSSERPLLPIDCSLMEAQRVRGIIEDHQQVRREENGQSQCFVLLINVDQLPEAAQQDLLRLIEQLKNDLRLLCTANYPLDSSDGFLRELASQLSTLEMRLPVLAERPEDVPLLAQVLLEDDLQAVQRKNRGGQSSSVMPVGFSREATVAMQIHSWPRDFQQLKETVKVAVDTALSRINDAETTENPSAAKREIRLADFPYPFRVAVQTASASPQDLPKLGLDDFLAQVEREMIQRAISASQGNKTRAARLLGMTRARLHRKLQEDETPQQKPRSENET